MANKIVKSVCIDKECEDKLKELGGSAWINKKIIEEQTKPVHIDGFWENIDNELENLENKADKDFKDLMKIKSLKRKKEINGRL